MFSFIDKLTGVKITETPETYVITGFNGLSLSIFIQKYWKTSVIDKYMFKTVTSSKIEFYKFFLLDVLYMLEKLAGPLRRKNDYRYVNVRTLNDIINVIKTKTWFNDIENDNIKSRLNLKRLEQFNYPPLPHQLRWLEYYDKTPTQYKLNGALLNGAPGSGKTLTSLYTMECAEVDKVIIVCPKNALNRVWVGDLAKHFKQMPTYFNTGANIPFDASAKYFVYHYEALPLAFEHHAELFKQYKYGLILDESHNLNEINSARTKLWLELVARANSDNVIHMSGTPFKAMGSESIPLLRAIDPLFTNVVEERYKKIFGHSAQKGMDILKNRLGIISFVVKKDELNLDKPEIIVQGVKTPNGNKYTLTAVRNAMKIFIEERYKYYKAREDEDNAFFKECLAIHKSKLNSNGLKQFDIYLSNLKQVQQANGDLQYVKDQSIACKQYEKFQIEPTLPDMNYIKRFRDVISVIKYVGLKIQGECLGRVVGRMRIDAHREMCAYIPFDEICNSTEKKTVVFTSFVDVLEDAEKACIKQGLHPILVYGKTNKDLAGSVAKFDKDRFTNPLIATYDSLSTAVPLVMADTMIMINAPFRTYIQEQAISRIHRIGQNAQTRVFQLYLDTGAEKNISERSLDIMRWSQEQVEAITGIKSPYDISESETGATIGVEGLEDLSIELYKLDLPLMTDKPKLVTGIDALRHW